MRKNEEKATLKFQKRYSDKEPTDEEMFKIFLKMTKEMFKSKQKISKYARDDMSKKERELLIAVQTQIVYD